MMFISKIQKAWHKRYLLLDRWMAGTFFKVFIVTLACVTALFLLLYYLSHALRGWGAGQVFIQMTNPTPTHKAMDGTEWIILVIVNIFGMFVVNGVLLTLLVNWVTNRRQRFLNGEARYGILKTSRYAVVIGGHSIVPRLVADIMEKEDVEYTVIMTSRNPMELRREVYSHISNPRKAANVIIYYGDRTMWHELEDLHLDHAQSVYIIGEDSASDKAEHDANNLKCWHLIRTHMRASQNIKLPCHIFIEDMNIFNIFRTTDVDLDDTHIFRFIPFNMEQCWARTILTGASTNAGVRYLPLDGEQGISYDSARRVHLIITGSNFQALSLMTEAAQLNHYPNFLNPRLGNPKTRITVVDPDIRTPLEEMHNRLPYLFKLTSWKLISFSADDTVNIVIHNPEESFRYLGENLTDVEFEFIEGDIETHRVREFLSTYSVKDSIESITTLAICDNDDHAAIRKAMTLPEALYDKCHQILVRQQLSSDIIDGLRNGQTGKGQNRFRKLLPFGMKADMQYLNLADLMLPQYVHYAYSVQSRGSSFIEEYNTSRSREDFNQKVVLEWNRMEQEGGKTCIAKRWSNCYCADHFPIKWRSVKDKVKEGELITDPDLLLQLAQTEHNRWVMEQLMLGMRPPGAKYSYHLPIESRELRSELKAQGIHPDLISYQLLGSSVAYDQEIVKLVPLLIHL